MDNSREVASAVSMLLLILCQRLSTTVLIQRFLQQRITRRRLRLRFLNAIIHCFHYLCMRRNVHACNPRRIWVLPQPQELDHWWQHLSIFASLLDQHFVDRYTHEGCYPLSKRESGQVYGDWRRVNFTDHVD